jgi:tRNA (guanine-N7-)-methyltransferase
LAREDQPDPVHSLADLMQSDHPRRRSIRSFVRRAGRLTPSQQRALDELWPEFGVDYEPDVLDLGELFGREAPRVLEIGFGNGETLVQQASENPEADYLGIEVHEPGVGHCLIAARDAGISNLKLITHDAIDVLQQLPPASLQRINLYFPDPWPKKRHHKRRIVQPSFITSCAGLLVPSGSLHVATDWANYAEHIDAALSESTLFTCAERREHAGDEPLDRPMTKFERRGLKRGHRIWDWRFEKSDL